MTWGRLDDTFWRHRKLTGTSLAATGLQVRALSYCNDQLNDGYLTPADLDRLAPEIGKRARRKLAAELVTRNIWEENGEGWHVHDYLDYNRPAAEVLAERAHLSEVRSKAGSKGAAKRWHPDSNGDGKPHGKPMAPVPYPEPTPKTQDQNQEQRTALRSRDAVFDAVAEWQGTPHGRTPTRALARTIGMAVADIRRVCPDVTPEETCRRIENMPPAWESAGPMALAKHWDSLDRPPSQAVRPVRDRAQELAERALKRGNQ
jgi:hypothetical protein